MSHSSDRTGIDGPVRRRAGRTPWLRRPEDAAGVFYSSCVWAAYLLAFTLFSFPTQAGIRSLAGAVAFLLGAGFLLGLLGGWNVLCTLHAHVHRPFFRAPLANRWFGRLTALSAGWPALLWAHMHHRHHALALTEADWTAPRRLASGRFEGLVLFGALLWPLRVFRGLRRELHQGRIAEPVVARRELALFAVLYCLPALLGPWVFVGLWVLPHLIANLVVLASFSYLVTLGGRRGAATPALTVANSFEPSLPAALALHVGLASVHYAWPEAHWSKLPALHERERGRMIDQGTHVLPYGPLQAAEVLGGFLGLAAAQREFEATQARDYGTPHALRAPVAAEPMVPSAATDAAGTVQKAA